MTRKLRILMPTEFSGLNTGYSVYTRNLLQKLYSTNKYEIAELACYCQFNNPLLVNIPWRVYSNLPTSKDEENEYNSNIQAQFGEWRLNDVILDFRPDIVLGIRDFWMESIITNSPLYPFFYYIFMPAIDSAPPQEGWIEQMSMASRLLVYSEYGKKIIENETNGRLKVFGIAPPGANQNFQPIINKKGLREKYKIPHDAFIVGKASRNQKRKLFSDLIETFSHFLKDKPNKNKIFLYLHTSFPDVGWDIPRIIKNSGISSNILLTYICTGCKNFFPFHFTDSRRICPICGSPNVILPNTQVGVRDDQLNEIYNLMDVHVQYSIAEAFGLTNMEAASCGTPVMGADYAAMTDILDQTKGYKIKIDKYFLESETHQYRVYPSNAHLLELLNKFYNLPPSLRQKKGREAYLGAKQKYDWDKTAKVWESCIDSLSPKNIWENPPDIYDPPREYPQNIDNEMMVRWAISNVLRDPSKMNSFFAHRLIRDLNYGASTRQTGGFYFSEDAFLSHQTRYKPYNVVDMLNELAHMRQQKNYWEKRRVGQIKETRPIVQYSKPAENEL